MSTQTLVKQTLTIPYWHPTMSANGSVGHWATRQKKHNVDRDTAWAAAKHAGWTFVPGRVKLTVTLVYPRKYRVDADNLAARCKGIIDGLKLETVHNAWVHHPQELRHGFFWDDSTEWLDLHVQVVVDKGVRETRIELEAIA